VQVLYLLPFVLVSFVSGAVCLIVPRWRRYVAGAVISPIAFAGCSIIGMLVVVLLAEKFGVEQIMGLDKSLDSANWRGVITVATLYVLQGAIGAVVAASVANRVQRWTLHRLGF
jgi:hypothetical protein